MLNSICCGLKSEVEPSRLDAASAVVKCAQPYAMRVAAIRAFALLRAAAALQPPAPRRSSSLLRAAPAPDAWNAYELGAARALAASAPAKTAAAFFSATGPLPLNAALALPLAAKLDWSRPWRPRPTDDLSLIHI